ncbi:Leucine-rich repeat domain superfamily protein [Abortiporus biennis]
MHRVFLIDELVREIVTYVRLAREDQQTATQALLPLRLTSKLFEDPILDILWENVILRNISSCLCSLGIAVKKSSMSLVPNYGPDRNVVIQEMKVVTYDVAENVTPEKILSARKYLSRIKELWVRTAWRVQWSVDLTMALFPFSHCIFTKLQCLDLIAERFMPSSPSGYLNVFTVPSLQEVRFTWFNSRAHEAHLYFIGLRCPQLREMRLMERPWEDEPDPQDFTPTLAKYLPAFISLQSVDLTECSWSIWSVLSSIPSLYSVKLSHAPLASGETVPVGIQAVLSTVKRLMLTQSHADFNLLSKVLATCSFPQLEKFDFEMTYTQEPLTAHAYAFFHAISSACSPDHLVSINIWHDSPTPERVFAQGNLINASVAFKPLLRFKKLRRFTLETSWFMDVREDILQKMAVSWPMIKRLELDVTGLRVEQTIPSISILQIFTEQCLGLENLSLVIDADTTDMELPRIAPYTSSNPPPNLKNLCVGVYCIHDAHQIASFLTGCFPNLRQFFYADEPHHFLHIYEQEVIDDWVEEWDMVSSLIYNRRSV